MANLKKTLHHFHGCLAVLFWFYIECATAEIKQFHFSFISIVPALLWPEYRL